MRVENNIFALNNNFGVYNNKKNTNRVYLPTSLHYDTVSFSGRRPKDFVKAEIAIRIEKLSNDATLYVKS